MCILDPVQQFGDLLPVAAADSASSSETTELGMTVALQLWSIVNNISDQELEIPLVFPRRLIYLIPRPKCEVQLILDTYIEVSQN